MDGGGRGDARRPLPLGREDDCVPRPPEVEERRLLYDLLLILRYLGGVEDGDSSDGVAEPVRHRDLPAARRLALLQPVADEGRGQKPAEALAAEIGRASSRE